MKKIITLSISLLISSIGFSQNAPINFETGGIGASWAWTVFENGTNPALEFVANPSATGLNTSSTVAKFTALQVGQPYAGCESANGTSIGSFTLSATNSTVKIMVYKPVISDVGIKFATSTGASSGEIKVANTLINQWEELTFNFAGKIGEPSSTGITQIIVFPDFNARSSDVVCYFDNITFSAGSSLAEPTLAAPTPTKLAADVISLFSNAYTNITVDTWRTSWSAATLTDLQIAGNDAKKYSGLDFVGIEMVNNQVNITAMDAFEFDLWTPNSTSFRFKLVDFGPNGIFGGGDDVEHETMVTPTLNGWNHIAVPIGTMTGLTTKANIAQLIFASSPAGTSVVYVDNILFSKGGGALAEPTVAAPTPTKLAADVISLFSNAYTNVTVDTWRTGWSAATLNDIQIAGNDAKQYTALDFVGIEMVANQINITNMDLFEFDFWTPNSTSFRFKLVDFGPNGIFGGGDDVEHETIVTPTLAGWNHVAVPIATMTGLTTKSNIAQLILASSPTGTSIVYIDNVLFSKDVVVAAPTVAAPTPTDLAANVTSLFSNAFTNVTVDTWRTGWSAATLTDIQIAGDDVKQYSALDFVGVEMVANQLNVTAMDSFEFDLWTPNSTSFRFKIVDFGANAAFGGGDDVEAETMITPTLNGWNHVSVALSSLTALTTKANIAQLIFASSPAGTSIAYIDNVLFTKKAVVGVGSTKQEAISIYPNPASSSLNLKAATEIQSVIVYNTLGQVVLTATPNASFANITIAELPTGLYTVKASINGVDTFSKIVKE